jgi:uncharacterized SAM-binding protein YcdF (DUF218 family)
MRLVFGTALGIVVIALWAVVALHTAPVSNTSLTRFDTIIVLGTPPDGDGNPTPEMLARVSEGVHEYERGVAPRILFTGGAAHTPIVEAQVMARAAEADGIPASAIIVESSANDTIQNVCYSARIMKAHSWRSAEVISSPYHLPRAAIILGRSPILWRIHPAAVYGYDPRLQAFLETLKTVRYLVYAGRAERCDF